MANALTIARIGLVLPFAWLFFIGAPWAMKAALAIFVIAALTDFLDGWIARALKQTSALGAALDPLADKLLVAAALVLLVRNGVIRDASVVAVLIILMREIFVMGLREAIAVAGRALPVTGLAKWKTAAQLAAVSLLLAAAPGGLVGDPARAYAAAALWFAAILTLWTGADYAVRGLRALKGAPR